MVDFSQLGPNRFPGQRNKRLTFVSDRADWALDEDLRFIKKSLGLVTSVRYSSNPIWPSDFLFFLDRYKAASRSGLASKIHKAVGTNVFHGAFYEGEKNSRSLDEQLAKMEPHVDRYRVSNSQMYSHLSETGLARKVSLIPIGVDTSVFFRLSEAERVRVRNQLSISESDFVIGSFQKDGVGWSLGDSPKRVKGPDLFVEAVKKINKEMSNLVVLLSGPSRGFVVDSLRRLDIRYIHQPNVGYEKMVELYSALDMYLICSRDEGGPKALLEAMSCGVPVVSTQVGQALDLIDSGQNGLLVKSWNPEDIASSAIALIADEPSRIAIARNANVTARANNVHSQKSAWADFFFNSSA